MQRITRVCCRWLVLLVLLVRTLLKYIRTTPSARVAYINQRDRKTEKACLASGNPRKLISASTHKSCSRRLALLMVYRALLVSRAPIQLPLWLYGGSKSAMHREIRLRLSADL